MSTTNRWWRDAADNDVACLAFDAVHPLVAEYLKPEVWEATYRLRAPAAVPTEAVMNKSIVDPNTSDTFMTHVLRGGARVTIATPRGTAAAEVHRENGGDYSVDPNSIEMPPSMPKHWRGLIEDLACETGSVRVAIDGAGVHEIKERSLIRRIPVRVVATAQDRYGACNVEMDYHGNIGTWVFPKQDEVWVSRPAWVAGFAQASGNGIALAIALSRAADCARTFEWLRGDDGFVYLDARIVGHTDIEFTVTVPR